MRLCWSWMNFLAAWLAIRSASSRMFSRARQACGKSFRRAFRALTCRLFMPPEPRYTKWNGADPRCNSFMISSAASALRRLRSTDAPDSSSSSSESFKLSFVPGPERQLSVDVRTAAPAVVACSRDAPKLLKSCKIFLTLLTRISGTCVCRIGSPIVILATEFARGIDSRSFHRP